MVCLSCIFKSFGVATLTWIIIQICLRVYRIVYPYFIAKPVDLLRVAGGKWAVVTGATDGIGKAYAIELARRGFNILLISRTQSKLDDVKKEIESECKVEVKTIAFDFSVGDVTAYQKELVPQLTSLDVGILVNNVGDAYDYPDVLHKVQGGIEKLARINIIDTLPVTLLSATVLSQMVERDSGCVINIASGASDFQTPMWGAYSAAKKYVSWLSGVMQKEYAKTNIIIQNVRPHLVATKMSKVKKSITQPDAETYVKSALNTIGIQNDTCGHFAHQFQNEIGTFIPFIGEFLFESATRQVHKKAMKKKLKELSKTPKAE